VADEEDVADARRVVGLHGSLSVGRRSWGILASGPSRFALERGGRIHARAVIRSRASMVRR